MWLPHTRAALSWLASRDADMTQRHPPQLHELGLDLQAGLVLRLRPALAQHRVNLVDEDDARL